jgi:hypothetical protein
MCIKWIEIVYAKSVFLSWRSARRASGFHKLGEFLSLEHEVFSFGFFILNFFVIVASEVTVFVMDFCSDLMKVSTV